MTDKKKNNSHQKIQNNSPLVGEVVFDNLDDIESVDTLSDNDDLKVLDDIDYNSLNDAANALLEQSQNDSDSDENLPVLLEDYLPQVLDKSVNKLNQYLKEISRYELLSREQEQALSKQLKDTGDINIAKKLVVSNLRLVVKIAMDYKYAYSNVMDLIQEGNIGLMKAVSMYDPDKGAKLSYYASWWIKSYILKFILDNFRLVKIGTTNDQKKLFYNLVKEKDRLKAQGIEPDHKTIAKNLNVSEKSVAIMEERLSPGQSDLSLDHKVNDDSNMTFGDFLSVEEDFTEDISYRQSLSLLQENLDDFMDGLKTRDRKIFSERLLSDAPRSLQSIADDYGVSRERIRQIEARLIENLRLYMSKYIR